MYVNNQIMNKLLRAFLFVFLSHVGLTFANAQEATGIQFFEGNWQETLEKARQEDKMIFIDCYTSWCGPCKKLAKEVFPDPKAGAFFNEHFVSVKVDMEKGEGIELKEKFNVSAFPTMLFITQNDVEQHRIVGFRTPDKLIAEARNASSENSFGSMSKRYQNGERSSEFIGEYIKVLRSAGKREELNEITIALMMELKPQLWLKDNNWAMIKAYVSDPHSEIIQYIQKNQNRFIAVHGSRAVEMKLYSAFAGGTNDFIIEDAEGNKRFDEEGYKDYLQMLQDLNVKRWENMKLDADMRIAFNLQQWDEHIQLVQKKIDTLDERSLPQMLWNFAARINKSCPDLKTRAIAVEWCELAIKNTAEGKSTKSFEDTIKELKQPMQTKK